MSLLRSGDVLRLSVGRKIRGLMVYEMVEVGSAELRWLSTPELLRAFSAQVDRACTHLDAEEEHGRGEAGQVDVFFIDDQSGEGALAHNRKVAHQYLDALLDTLKAGEGASETGDAETLTITYRAMTPAELEALPEV